MAAEKTLTLEDLMPTTSAEIADELANEMPEVQEHVVQAEAAQHIAQETAAAINVEVDAAGEAFNTILHTGSKLKNGLWRRRRGATPSSSLGTATPVHTGPTQEEISGRASGVVAAGLLITTGVIVGGDEFNPRTDETIGLNERVMLERAFGDYFVATGRTDFPPGATLAIVIGMYVLPRLTMPKTQSRMKRVKEWIAVKVTKWKMRRAAQAAAESVA